MTQAEALRLARSWTKDIDANLDGWRSAMFHLVARIDHLEENNRSLYARLKDLNSQIDALSLDLGLKDNDFRLPEQTSLLDVMKIVREIDKDSW